MSEESESVACLHRELGTSFYKLHKSDYWRLYQSVYWRQEWLGMTRLTLHGAVTIHLLRSTHSFEAFLICSFIWESVLKHPLEQNDMVWRLIFNMFISNTKYWQADWVYFGVECFSVATNYSKFLNEFVHYKRRANNRIISFWWAVSRLVLLTFSHIKVESVNL